MDNKLSIAFANIDLNDDGSGIAKVSSLTVSDTCNHKDHKVGTMKHKVRAFLQQEHRTCDKPPTSAALIAAQVLEPTCQQYAATMVTQSQNSKSAIIE